MSEPLDAVAFGRLFQRFLETLDARLPPDEPSGLVRSLTGHLGREPQGLPVVAESFPVYDHANVQMALDRSLAAESRTAELIGVSGAGGREHHTFTELVDTGFSQLRYGVGAVDYVTVPVGVGEDRTCVRFGLYLASDGAWRFAVLLRTMVHNGPPRIVLEVLAAEPERAGRFLAEIRELIGRYNVFRGKIVSIEGHEFGHGVGPVRFHARPEVGREDVILPAGVLEAIERHVIGVGEHRDRLLAAGHHLKRGVLLFGPPGSGKTHTVRHLMSRLPGVTVVVVTGSGVHFIREACALARLVTPAMVIVEDVDLIAESRAFRSGMSNPLLFQILNEMDGISGDSDVAFVLTTNRADLIEPALAERPGRVDLAVEIPQPDAPARRRLLALYGAALRLTSDDREAVVAETEDVAASFFSELARRAELLAATGAAETADDTGAAGLAAVRAALAELRTSRDALATSGRPPARAAT